MFYGNVKDSTNSFIKNIFQQAIQEDPWFNQIQHLSLSKLPKIVVMNSWKQTIDIQKINLNVRSNFFHLYSKILHDIIQLELSRDIGKSVTLHILKNDNFLKKTPIEYLHIIYQKQLLQLVEKFSYHPNILMIKSFFDISFDKSDINFI